MKLGIIALPEEKSFVMAKEKGLSYLEFCIDIREDLDSNVNEICAKQQQLLNWSRQYGVDVGSVGRWGTKKIDEKGNLIEDELKRNFRLIDLAAALGCTNYNTGCNYVESLTYNENIQAAIRYFQTVVDYGRDKGVKISVVNCHWGNFVNGDPEWSLILGQIPELYIKYDVSHSRYAGRDYLSEAKKWGHRFNHVHIKGSLIIDGERFDDPPAGLDQTNWGAFMAVLYKIGYSNGISIEPHSSTWRGELGEKGVDYTIGYIRKMIF